MRLRIEHRTTYRYGQPQRRVIQLLRMTPQSFAGQAVTDWHVEVDCDARLRTGRDGYGNETTMLYVDGPVDAITLTATGEVLTEDRAGVVLGAPEPLPPLLFARATPQTAADDAIRALAEETRAGEDTALGRLHTLNAALHARIRFDPGAGDPHRTAAATLADGHGVCQDMTHVFLAVSRLIGAPARYVSGHLFRSDGQLRQPAAHAWAEAWVEGLGWVGFDPTNGVSPTDAYVRVAVGLDYRDAAPVAGARVGGGTETLAVEVTVARAPGQGQRQGPGGQSQGQG